ncbi:MULTISPECIES: hypothetical protein [Pseudanabaena]|uniref:Uncharacterized protein n=2 Tax=Pseudanabaena TaxID=1152 RepID=L8MZJ1_9CYAN|nr:MULTISPECIES: hypothetical protein [Pseudanabaena]ELS31408.1 hypothetical protein Pse7429DRAFT_3684 [Pseudanabaena biceps PCC 7429]MDG3496331.1 hypothetical protein [Pseudanabaena catenata USMAC16]
MTAQPMNTKIMIQSDFAKRLQSLELGLQKTQSRLEQFEAKYQWSTETFINLFTSDQAISIN